MFRIRRIAFAITPLLFAALIACSGGHGGASSVLPTVGGPAESMSAASMPAGSMSATTAVAPDPLPVSANEIAAVAADSRSSFGDAQPAAIVDAAPAGERAHSADSLPGDHDVDDNFIDSIALNIKIDRTSQPYANYSAVKHALLDLGIRHIRDGFSTSNPNDYEGKLADLASSGIHSDLVLVPSEDSSNNAFVNVTSAAAVAYLRAGHYARSIEAIEGINEPDINQTNPNGPTPHGWIALTRREQRALYSGVRGLPKPIPVYGPSPKMSNVGALGNLSSSMDYGNIHNYSGGYDSPAASVIAAVSQESAISGSKPVTATENGFSTGTTGQGMPDLIMLDYAQRMFFKQYTHGVKRTAWYELLDENATPNDYWNQEGLLTSSFRPKLAYYGLKNIIALLRDQTGYRARTSLNFSFGGQTQFENIEHLLLQKNDGSFWLIVWRDLGEWDPAPNGVRGTYPVPDPGLVSNSLNFVGTYVSSITEYHEDYTGAMVHFGIPVMNGTTAQVQVAPRPTIFKIVPGIAPAAIAAPRISNPAAHWSTDEGSGLTAGDSVNGRGNMSIPNKPSQMAWVSGKYRTALAFNGTQATTALTPVQTAQSFSATAWVQMNSVNGFQSIFAVNGRSNSAFALDFTPSSHLSFTMYNVDSASATPSRIGSSFVPKIGQWYAVAATYNASNRKMSFYINGTLQSTGTCNGVFNASGGAEIGSMLQGGVGHWQWFNGGVDEINVYQRELTPGEVRTMAGG